MTVNVYEQYFEAKATFFNVPRRAARVTLQVTSEQGHVRYDATVTFFPHTSDDDFSITYDAICAQCMVDMKGRRSKKREAELLKALPGVIDELSADYKATVFWDKPLIEARRG